MISRAVALVAAGVVAGSVEAQTIVTRSGEHDGFTRLVMRIPDNIDWSLTQTGRMATVNVGSSTAVFDTKGVFSLIPRERILDVYQTGPGQPLRVDLGCECVVEHYQQADGYLVIDVRESDGPLPQTAFGLSSGALPLIVPSQSYGFNLGSDAIARSQFALGLGRLVDAPSNKPAPELPLSDAYQEEIAKVEAAESADKESQEMADQSLQTDPATLFDLEEGRRTAIVNDTEARLLQQIGRATDQGLIQLEGELERADLVDPLGNSGRPMEGLPNVSVTSAVDRETGLLAVRKAAEREDSLCLRNSRVAIHKWQEEGSFDDQIGRLRNKMLGEFDQIDKDVVQDLAMTYLFFGFGAEAISVLRMLPEGSIKAEKREVMIAMGRILDGEELQVNNVFAGQQSCKGDVAFWATMATNTVKKSADTDAIQQAFAKLPPHLRRHLGPRMSKIFAEAGDPHVAKVALRSVDRISTGEVPDMNLAEAAIAELEGKPEEVTEHLTDEVAERTHNAPAALIELIDLSVAERKALSPDVPELTASYELESRETELGRDLRRAEVAALALTGRFDEAFQSFEALEARDGPAARKAASGAFFQLLTENADDVTFLRYGLDFAHAATVSEAEALADDMARRMLDLGFPQEASVLLSKVSLDEENEARRMMNAEIALALEEPQRALVELMGLESKQADAMRAQALWQNEEYQRASEYLLQSDDPNGAARGYWYSSDFDAAESLDRETAPFGAVAELTTDIDTSAQRPEGLPPLAEARALVESSMNARSEIEALLRQVQRTPEN